MTTLTCPVCDEAFRAQVLGLVECPHCRIRFLPPGLPLATLITAGPDDTPREAAAIRLSPEFLQKYALKQVLGTGAFGTVYAAKEQASGTTVAVKFFTRLGDSVARDRFLREGNLLRQLSSPNIVQVAEVYEFDSYPCIVSEFVSGGTLENRLKRTGRLDVAQAVAVTLDVLRGLDACHQLGIIHRDLKPSNILMEPSGRAKIADFGIAKQLASAESTLTTPGLVLGTPAYMSPEQGRGDPVGPASDLYSTGVILYEMLAGVRPITGANAMQYLVGHQTTVPRPIRDILPELSPDLAQVVQKALAKAPTSRPASAVAFAALLDGQPSPAPRPVTMVRQQKAQPAASGRSRIWLAWCVMCLMLRFLVQFLVSPASVEPEPSDTDAFANYACRCALQEALMHFKANMNPSGQSASARALHESLTRTGQAAALVHEPVLTRKRYAELYGAAVKIAAVKISFDAHPIESSSHSSNVNVARANSTIDDTETKGLVIFETSANCGQTVRFAARAYEYRQILVRPPPRLAPYPFVATQWRYLGNRLHRMNTDWLELRKVVQRLVERVCFGYTLLRYICEPPVVFGEVPAVYVVGMEYARRVYRQVLAQARQVGRPAVETQLARDLGVYARSPDHLPNPNFNLTYFRTVAVADTRGLQLVLTSLSREFGLALTGDGPILRLEDPYPLSPTGLPTKNFVTSYNRDKYTLRNWGQGRKMGTWREPVSGRPLEAPAFALSLDSGGSLPVLAVEPAAKGDSAVESTDLELCPKIPPVLVDTQTNTPRSPPDEVEPFMGAVGITRELALATISDCHLRMLSCSSLGPLGPAALSDARDPSYRLPTLFLGHPKADYDWAFRLGIEDYKTNFTNRAKLYEAWRDRTLRIIKTYVDAQKSTMERVGQRLRLIPGTERELLEYTADGQAAERAAYCFPSPQAFERATGDLLSLDGLYLVRHAHGRDPVRISAKAFRGRGIIVAGGFVVPHGLRKSSPVSSDALVLCGTDPEGACTLGGVVEADIISRSSLRIEQDKAALVRGQLVVRDTPGRVPPGTSLSDVCGDHGEADMRAASHYFAGLPPFRIRRPATDTAGWRRSHMTLCPYPVVDGSGKRTP